MMTPFIHKRLSMRDDVMTPEDVIGLDEVIFS
jgi:hypothetical protein